LKTIDLNLDDENLAHKLNEKLDELIIQERYEEAIAIRDFMTIKKIPRNSGSS
jgi:protein-arginine kinase activator protein McsA